MKRQLIALALLGLASTPLWAANCATTIEGTDSMQFNKSSIVVPASCKTFTVTLKHTGTMAANVMGHDWVLAKKSDEQGILADGVAAGLAKDYLKPGDKRVIAHTKIIGAGQTASVTFKVAPLKQGGPYEYFCSFPGHATLMHGTLTVK
ncbi:MAG TPA: azurin [Rhodanobacteraceae bacterium]